MTRLTKIRELNYAVTHETLHGALPLKTSMQMAEDVQFLLHALDANEKRITELREALKLTLTAMRTARDEWPNYQPDVQWVTAWDAARAALEEK